MDFKVKIDVPSGITATPIKLEDGLVVATKESTMLVTNEAINGAPMKYGTLKRSIRSEVVAGMGRFTGSIIQDTTIAKYGAWVERGTGIYGPYKTPIVPVHAKMLAWKVPGGSWYRAKSVKGMMARPYMKPALLDNREKIKAIFQARIKQALGGE
jgi:hypothetical protein